MEEPSSNRCKANRTVRNPMDKQQTMLYSGLNKNAITPIMKDVVEHAKKGKARQNRLCNQ